MKGWIDGANVGVPCSRILHDKDSAAQAIEPDTIISGFQYGTTKPSRHMERYDRGKVEEQYSSQDYQTENCYKRGDGVDVVT